MTTDLDERLDLSDLDLLDDASRHCRCTYCDPRALDPLVPYVAICGRRVVFREPASGPPTAVPPNACDECRAKWLLPCERCGR